MNVGDFWAAQEVVAQYAFEAPWGGRVPDHPAIQDGRERRDASVAGDERGIKIFGWGATFLGIHCLRM